MKGMRRPLMRQTFVSALADRRLFVHSMILVGASMILIKVSSYGKKIHWVVRWFSFIFFVACFLRIVLSVIRIPLLKFLFRHHPWAYAPNSNKALAWEAAVGLLLPRKGVSGKAPLFAYCMPDLPLPPLSATLSRHVESLRSLLSPDKMAHVEASAKKLQTGRGGALQGILRQGMNKDEGWLAPWEMRMVSMQASNTVGRWYMLDGIELPGEGARLEQAERAACLAGRILDFALLVRRGGIPAKGYPQRFTLQPKVVPRCVSAFDALFTASLVPREGGYEIVRHDWIDCAKHAVVFREGDAFTVELRDAGGRRINDMELMRRLVQVMVLAESGLGRPKGLLKGCEGVSRLPRELAHKARRCISEIVGPSKDALNLLETAAILISLDSCTCRDKSEQASNALMGDAGVAGSGGYGRWLERAFTLVVTEDCRASLSCVGPLAEMSVTCQMWEHALAREGYPLAGTVDEKDGYAPMRIHWNSEKLAAATKASHHAFVEEVGALHVRVMDLSAFSRSKIRCRIPPHAFVHLAAQVAYGRAHGEACFSRDWVSTRIFREGRYDYARTMTRESLVLLKAMSSTSTQTLSQQRKALQDASDAYVKVHKETMLGGGVQSHLDALREVASVGNDGAEELGLLSAIAGAECKLTTCMVPVQVIAGTKKSSISVGAGVSPPCSQGYGVSFAMVGDDRMFAHVQGAPASNSTTVDVNEYCRHLLGTLRDMHHVASSLKARRIDLTDDDD